MASKGLEYHVLLNDSKFKSALQSMEAHTVSAAKRINDQFKSIGAAHASMMADIKKNHKMLDGAESQFKKIQKAHAQMSRSVGDRSKKTASEVGSSSKKIDAALQRNALGFTAVTAASYKYANTVPKNNEKIANSTVKVTESQERLTESSARLSKVYQGVAVAIGTVFYTSAADQYINLRNQIFDTTKTSEQFVQMMDGIRVEANSTNSAIGETALVYSRMRKAVADNVVSNDELLKVTSTINRAIKLNGTTTNEAEGALIQLSQALGSGALRGEEFNSVNEQMPAVLDAIAKHLGVARGELKAMAAQGKLTSEIVIESLQRAEKDIENRFNKRIETMSEKLVEAKNNAVVFFGEFEVNSGIARSFGDSVVFLSENIQSLVDIATFGALVFGGKLVQGLFSANGAFGRLTGRIDEISKSLTSTTKKTNGLNSALGMRSADSGAKKISGLNKALSIGLSLIGGWPSLVIAAAAALASFAASSGEARESAEKLNKQLAIQNRIFDAMDRRQKSKFLDELNKQKQDLIGEQIEIGAKLSARSKEDVLKDLNEIPRQRIRTSPMGPGVSVSRDPERESALLKELDAIEQQESRYQSINQELDEITKKQLMLFQAGMPETTEFESLDAEAKKQREIEEGKRSEHEKTTKQKLALLERELEAYSSAGMTELDILKENKARQLEVINEAAELEIISEQEKNELKKAIEQQYYDLRSELAMTDYERQLEQAELELELQRQLFEEGLINNERLKKSEDDFSDKKVKIKSEEAKSNSIFRKKEYSQTVDFLNNMGAINEKFAKAAFFLTKAKGIGEATINTAVAVSEALPDIPKAIWAGVQGAAQIASIASTSFGGGGGTSSVSGAPAPQSDESQAQQQVNQQDEGGFLVTEFSGTSFGEGGSFGFAGQISASDEDRILMALSELLKRAGAIG